jgi:hypothetical protein
VGGLRGCHRAATLCLTLLAAHTAWGQPAEEPADARRLARVSLVRILQDDRALDFAVKAKIYPEDPDSMFVTLRGGGVSVYDVSAPDDPRLRTRWDTATDVEGQDRRGDLLVVVARSGALLTFDVSDPAEVRHLATLELDTQLTRRGAVVARVLKLVGGGPFGALHTKLYQASDDRLYALVTATASGELIAVDVTDPANPAQVGSVDTKVEFVEGIYVHRGHAFVGGFGDSAVYRAIDVSDPRAMRIVRSLPDESHRQMVSEMKPEHPDLLFAALWKDPGGLGLFDVEDPANFRALGAVLRPELAWSNRVKVQGDLAFLPLEQKRGGFGVVDVGEPSSPGLVALVRDIRGVTKPYTLAVREDHLYIFGTREATMAIFRLERGEAEPVFSRWNLGPGDEEALGDGRPADAGQGVLRFLDAAASGAGSTRVQTGAGSDGEVGYLEITPSGEWTAQNGLVLEHGFAGTFYGRLPSYTIVWDVQVPQQSFSARGCTRRTLGLCNDIPLYQLDRTNAEDADLFLKVGAAGGSPKGFVGKRAERDGGGLDGYVKGIQPDAWHRIALVVDLFRERAQASIYVDGELARQVDRVAFERFASVAEGDPQATVPVRDGFLLIADNDGEMNAPVRIASVLFVNRAYGADEVAALGPPGPEGIPAPR